MTATLPVNEIFQTIQGEGLHAGTPAVFIRLQGCPVGCPWCDTRFTWEQDAAKEIPAGSMLAKERSGEDSWAALDADTLCRLVARYRPQHIVITGGEPALHDLLPLTTLLCEQHGKAVQVETSGTYPLQVHDKVWCTVSPKLDMPGGRAVQASALARADEIKMPVGKHDDVQRLIRLLDEGHVRPGTPVYLQPLSLSPKATELCVQNATANGWKVSMQIHALAGWR